MKTIAAILAAGRGVRAGFAVPKQLALVSGHPLVWHSLRAFHDSPVIDSIILVASEECAPILRDMVAECGFSKVVQIAHGGVERSDSSRMAIACADHLCRDEAETDVRLLIHDAARPLVSGKMIADVARALDDFEAATIAAPASDTIAMADDDGTIADIPNRQKMFVVQTPQAFRLATLKNAFEIASHDPAFAVTDDCGVVKKYLPNVKIKIVAGASANMKLTYPSDLPVIEGLLDSRAG
jgi:2-C-methyl-D-erythritol 4-phosphate cytidylyltransferase